MKVRYVHHVPGIVDDSLRLTPNLFMSDEEREVSDNVGERLVATPFFIEVAAKKPKVESSPPESATSGEQKDTTKKVVS